MLMADTMSIFFVVVGLMLAFPGLWLLCRGLWPAVVESAADRCNRGLWSSLLLGVPISFLMIVVAAVLLNVLGAAGKIAGIGVICLYVLQANTGVAGFVTSIGRRLASPVDRERPWRATLRGGIVLELAWLLPILGWFGLLPLTIIIGCGAANFALFAKVRRTVASEGPKRPFGETDGAIAGPVGVA
jgi:hypothetical protein